MSKPTAQFPGRKKHGIARHEQERTHGDGLRGQARLRQPQTTWGHDGRRISTDAPALVPARMRGRPPP